MEGKNNTFKEYVAPVLVLSIICLVITLALAVTNGVTAPVIEANDKATADANRIALLADADSFTEYTGDLVEAEKAHVKDVYTADNGAGMVITVVTKSFGGDLTEMIGIDAEGAITGVVVTNHADTAGLGTKAHDPEYLKQYIGIAELQCYAAKDEAKAGTGTTYVSGASISSNGVHYGIKVALDQAAAVGGAK